MAKERIQAIPNAVRVTDGLRHSGYTPETAIADLVDNSVAAGATQVGLRLSKQLDQTYVVWIGDNGCGMDRETLKSAMFYGSDKSLARNALSVYGLGMKMASTTFSKRFSVVSRTLGGEAFTATYDLNDMGEHPWSFTLGESTPGEIDALENVARKGSGTVVIWEQADFRVREQNPKKKKVISSNKDLDKKIAKYLGMIFHRFMDGSLPEREKLQISLNDELITPWNPVHPDFHSKDWKPIIDVFYLEIDINGTPTQVPYTLTTYVLNGKEDPENKPGAFESSRMGMTFQGIYPYRENRILQNPSWLNVLTFHPDINALRATLELDPRLDEIIRTDVKKSGILLSDEMWQELRDVLESYKTQLKGAAKKKKAEKNKAKAAGADLHGGSNAVISSVGSDLPNAGVKRISPTMVEIDTIFGPSQTEIRDVTGPGSRDARIQSVDSLDDGILWEPRLNGSDQVILLNRSHPFYQKVYVALREDDLALQGLDFLLYALANAEWLTRTDRAKEQFTQMRMVMSSTLRTLVSELDEVDDFDTESDEFEIDS